MRRGYSLLEEIETILSICKFQEHLWLNVTPSKIKESTFCMLSNSTRSQKWPVGINKDLHLETFNARCMSWDH